MYICFIRSLLEYSDVIWDNCSVVLHNDVEAVQIEAARIATSATKLCKVQSLLSELKWEGLVIRRRNHRLCLLHKMKNGSAPQYLSNLVPVQTQDRYALRNAENIPLPIARSQLYNSSVLPATIRDWNALPLEYRNANSVQVFKHRLLTHKSKLCALLCVGRRIGQILHARVRLCCSSLNYDLFRKNITDSSLCTCNQVETAAHFLLYCPLYNRQRQLFFTTFHVHQQ